jgi:hypothetical protein
MQVDLEQRLKKAELELARIARAMDSMNSAAGFHASRTVTAPDFMLTGGPWIDVRTQPSLNDAITNIGSDSAQLLISEAVTLAASVAVPATLPVRFTHGGSITVPTGLTLTINSHFEAPLQQVFTCAGTGKVVFGPGATKEAYPEWWGADPNGVLDSYPAFALAVAALPSGGTVFGTAGASYLLSSLPSGANGGIYIHDISNLTLDGQGATVHRQASGTSTRRFVTVDGDPHVDGGTPQVSNVWVRNWVVGVANNVNNQLIVGLFRWTADCGVSNIVKNGMTGTALSVQICKRFKARDVRIYGAESGGFGILSHLSDDCTYDDCHMAEGHFYYGLQVKGGRNNVVQNSTCSDFDVPTVYADGTNSSTTVLTNAGLLTGTAYTTTPTPAVTVTGNPQLYLRYTHAGAISETTMTIEGKNQDGTTLTGSQRNVTFAASGSVGVAEAFSTSRYSEITAVNWPAGVASDSIVIWDDYESVVGFRDRGDSPWDAGDDPGCSYPWPASDGYDWTDADSRRKSTNTRFVNCSVEDCPDVTAYKAQEDTGCIWENCSWKNVGSGWAVVRISGGSEADFTLINPVGSVAYSGRGISIGGVSGNNITNVKVLGGRLRTTQLDGVMVYYGSDVTIDGLEVINPGQANDATYYGVLVTSESVRPKVLHANISSSDAKMDYGIGISAGVTNSVVAKNHIPTFGTAAYSIGAGTCDVFDADGTLTLLAGANVGEFSIDGTLAGNSDTALPTEKAVKAYVDARVLSAAAFPVVQYHLTASIAAGGTVVSLFTAAYATGILTVRAQTSSTITGSFACNRGYCVALGTLSSNLTNAALTASKVNVYYNPADDIVKLENNYAPGGVPTAITVHLSFIGLLGTLNTAI